MASRSRKPTPPATRGLRTALASDTSFLPALDQFLADEGQISIGTIGPIACAAVANDQHNIANTPLESYFIRKVFIHQILIKQ